MKSFGSWVLFAHAATVLVLVALFVVMYVSVYPTTNGPTEVVGPT